MATQGATKTAASGVQYANSSLPPAPVAISYPTEYRALPAGDDATFDTLSAMRDAVLIGLAPEYSCYQDEFNIRAAHAITSGATQHARMDVIAALFDFAAHQIQYVAHPLNEQTLQDAKRTMRKGEGDCVSLSVLLATLLAAVGIRSRFVAQWVDGREASHVYVEAELEDGTWIALDAVASGEPMGYRQPLQTGGFEVSQEIF